MVATGTENAGGERDLNKATVRMLQVLSHFTSDISGYGATELSLVLGMTKNMTYRVLTTLVEQGYLVREQRGSRYQLGYRVLELQNPLAAQPDFRTLCAPYVRRINALTGGVGAPDGAWRRLLRAGRRGRGPQAWGVARPDRRALPIVRPGERPARCWPHWPSAGGDEEAVRGVRDAIEAEIARAAASFGSPFAHIPPDQMVIDLDRAPLPARV